MWRDCIKNFLKCSLSGVGRGFRSSVTVRLSCIFPARFLSEGWKEVGILHGQLVWPLELFLWSSVPESTGYIAAAFFRCLGRISCTNAVQNMTPLSLCDAVWQKLPLSCTSVAIVELQSSAEWYIPKLQFTVMAFLLVHGPLGQTSSEIQLRTVGKWGLLCLA